MHRFILLILHHPLQKPQWTLNVKPRFIVNAGKRPLIIHKYHFNEYFFANVMTFTQRSPYEVWCYLPQTHLQNVNRWA